MPIFAAAALPFTMTAIGAGAAATGAIVGGHMQSSAANKGAQLQTQAANHAADVQAQTAAAELAATEKANADSLAFQRQLAMQQYQSGETDRRANYDQWAAREQRLNSVGAALGFGNGRGSIPAYVPSAAPNFSTPMAPAPQGPAGGPPMGATGVPYQPANDPRLYARRPTVGSVLGGR